MEIVAVIIIVIELIYRSIWAYNELFKHYTLVSVENTRVVLKSRMGFKKQIYCNPRSSSILKQVDERNDGPLYIIKEDSKHYRLTHTGEVLLHKLS